MWRQREQRSRVQSPLLVGHWPEVWYGWFSFRPPISATLFLRTIPKGVLDAPDKGKTLAQCGLEQEIASLETEMERVTALSTISDADCADLADRLHRLKKKGGMPSQYRTFFGAARPGAPC